MGVHERAWSGINIVVYGKVPLLPMQIEQALAGVSPGNEVKVDSFENFEDAYDFCKQRQDVGFFIVLDQCGDVAPHQAFNQLARHYEERGMPSFGVLVYAEKEQFNGYRSLQLCPKLLGYMPASDFLDEKKCADTFRSLWLQFIERFEGHVVPNALQSSIFALVESKFPQAERQFLDRATTILTSNLNLSWMEMFALRWHFALERLAEINPAFHNTLRGLCELAQVAAPAKRASSLEEAMKAEGPLASRTGAVLAVVGDGFRNDSLDAVLNEAKNLSKPGAPALLRHLAQNAEALKNVATELRAGRNGRHKAG